MRFLTIVVLAGSLGAQETTPADQVAAPAAAAAKPADQATPPQAAAPATTPTGGEGWLQGSFEMGYRWIPNITGSYDAYRSVVNFGPGPRLLNADFTILDPQKRLFDRVDVHATSWGDPYNTLRVDMQKQGWYRLTADYRNIAYFNFLPSYADPTLNQGTLLDQNSFDTEIRNTDVQLDLLPNKWITPYLAFGRNTQFGRGITAFETDINQYPVASLYSDQTDNFRGGVRMELGHYHITLEQGGTTFKDDQGASDITPTVILSATSILRSIPNPASVLCMDERSTGASVAGSYCPLTILHAGRKCLGRLPNTPLRRALKRFYGASLIEVQHCVELMG